MNGLTVLAFALCFLAALLVVASETDSEAPTRARTRLDGSPPQGRAEAVDAGPRRESRHSRSVGQSPRPLIASARGAAHDERGRGTPGKNTGGDVGGQPSGSGGSMRPAGAPHLRLILGSGPSSTFSSGASRTGLGSADQHQSNAKARTATGEWLLLSWPADESGPEAS